MADLAELGIRIHSEEAAVADERLDDFAAAAMRAEAATEQLGAASRSSSAGVAVMTSAVRQQNAVMAASRMSMGLTAAEGLNLSRQFTDIGVTAAMGMNPLLIAIQQGPQVLDVFQQAAMRTGTSVVATMRAVAVATWTAMAPLLPFIAAAGVAAAAIGGTLALSTRSLNREFGDLTEGMGLTQKQLERVQNRGVTMGDVLAGTFSYLRDIIWDQVGPAVTAIGEWFSDAMDVATRALVEGTKAITGGFIGSFRAVRAVWGDLPAVMGDVAVSAVNVTIRAIEGMLNKARDGINSLIVAGRLMAISNSAFAPFNLIPLMEQVSLGQVGNRNAGAARQAGQDMAREFAGGVADGAAMVDRNIAALRNSILGAARDRIMEEAEDPEAARAGRGRRERAPKAAVERLQRIERINLRPLRGMFVDLYTHVEQLADALEMVDDRARDAARGMESAFGDVGRAMGDLLTVMTGYEAQLARIAEAEENQRLTQAQAAEARAQAQINHYGDMAAAARGFFQEGSDGWKVMLAIEQAYRAYQFASAIQAMALNAQETAASVSGSMAKGAASTAAGAAKMFEFLGPFAFPAVAAMLALLAGLGLSGGRGGGGSKHAAANDNASPDASTEAVRAMSARDAQSRDQAAAAIAAKVDVRVFADRDGLNAHVVKVAQGEAVKVAGPLTAVASAGTKRDTIQTIDRRYTSNRKAVIY